MQFKKTVLENGLYVITAPMKETETVTVVVMVGVGSRFETDKEAGLSHFIEHMLFKGTERRPTSAEISEELDSIGGEYNAFTAKDQTAYYAKVDARHGEIALDIIADIFLNSKFDPEEIKKESGAIVQEINMIQDDPRRDVGEIFEILLYGNNPLGRYIVGNKETVRTFEQQDFVEYLGKHYTAGGTVVCIAGKFDEQKFIEQIKKYFSSMKRGKSVSARILENQTQPALKIKFKETDQSHVVLGVRAYDENHEDRFALNLLATILGGNMSSRIFTEVREKRGLAYYVRTGVDAYQDCGYLYSQAGVEHGNLEETIKIILNEYKKIASEKVSEKELQRAKDYIKGMSTMHLESSDEVAMFLIDQEMAHKKIMTLPEIFEKIDKVTADDILRVAQDIFKDEKLNLALIGPHRTEEALKNILKL